MSYPTSPANPPAVASVAEWIARALLEGPDPARADETPGPLQRLFPWPLRWLLVVVAAMIGGVWADAGVAEQLSWGLDYAALIGVSLAASYWRLSLGINLALSAAWFVPFRSRAEHPFLWRVLHVVTFLNRQVGHLEALAVWLALALVAWPRLSVQLPFVVAVLLIGPPVINGLARINWSGGAGGRRTGELNWKRRPFIYGATLLGLLVVGLLAPHQVGKVSPIMAAIVLGGLLPRFIRSRWRGRTVAQEAQQGQQGRLDERAQFRAAQMRWSRLDVAFGPMVILALAVGAIVFAWQQRRSYDQALDQQVNPAGGGDGRACLRDPGGPAKAEVSLFIVADTQLHELQGRRFPGQIELADAFVPVAIRPVELDLLSVATWARFVNVHQQLAAHPGAETGTMAWAHLGDFSDLACAGEMSRATDMLARVPPGRLAGVAPGNHDKSFTGNFFWSPFWDSACLETSADLGTRDAARTVKVSRLEKRDSDALLQHTAEPRLVAHGRMRPVPNSSAVSRWITGRGSALVTVSPLGIIHHRSRQRGLIGIFMDTADERSFDFGIAGLFGTVSGDQVKTLLGMIHELQQEALADPALAPYGDPVYILFGHHPFDEITSDSQKRVAKLIGRLDRGADPAIGTDGEGLDVDGADEGEEIDGQPAPRVLALITAHTHLAQAAYHCVGGRFLREIVVGSTIDPPQEASLLSVGADEQTLASVRLRTLPAVAREGRTCGSEPAFTAQQCQEVMHDLADDAACGPLFEADAGPGLPSPARSGPRPDCQVLERNLPLGDRLRAARDYRGPATSDKIKQGQVVRTRRLFACLCRGQRCTPPDEAVKLTSDRAYHDFFLKAINEGAPAQRAAWEKELTCLSWAASAVQAHKASGMTMADALRCAFDDATLPAAKDYVAVLERLSCK